MPINGNLCGFVLFWFVLFAPKCSIQRVQLRACCKFQLKNCTELSAAVARNNYHFRFFHLHLSWFLWCCWCLFHSHICGGWWSSLLVAHVLCILLILHFISSIALQKKKRFAYFLNANVRCLFSSICIWYLSNLVSVSNENEYDWFADNDCLHETLFYSHFQNPFLSNNVSKSRMYNFVVVVVVYCIWMSRAAINKTFLM